ncbi:15-hydroxyprostaglandin dehydrogenase [NAD(+)]-like [Haliotis rubra]|uniref:15-hydroxyprostaglandin dehydrogenase [NAD(+)]-like n=1 Tax=Haliotis rubra TaxID=36100 RepID=UPI001EE4EDBA|nr:15-hydroxyprostaglandin dehydrogenase [NAD(+)]-like [Haliotis rubra]
MATARELQTSSGADNVFFVKCDVTNVAEFEDAFKAAVSKFGHVDVMCNNAGIMDERIWEKQLEINFLLFGGTMMALNHMRKDKGGRGGVIINTASLAGLVPTMWFPAYGASKSAVYHFTSSWAQNPDMKAAEVRLASICPMGAKTALMDLDEDQIVQYAHFKQTMERTEYCTVDQVVSAFLMAMEDDTINGIALTIRAKEGVEKKKLSMVPVE